MLRRSTTPNPAAEERAHKKLRLSEEPTTAPATPTISKPSIDDIDDEEENEEDVAMEDSGPQRASDLYLETVNRATLDFDFEKLCSISLSNINIYGCLVCGKYFQGRGKSSYAYAHSIHDDHHVFINLETQLVYVLPDGYLVQDPSLDDISAVLNPVFTRPQVQALCYSSLSTSKSLKQTSIKPSFDLASKPYTPGYIGLNNIKANDYLNVIVHALLHVPPLRDYLLLSNFSSTSALPTKGGAVVTRAPELLKRFASLAKKVWNPRLFKAQVSPHEFLQEVARASGGKFKMTEQGDPVDFLGWLLNQLHRDMGGGKKKNSSVIYSTFQGELRMETQQVVVKPDKEGGERPFFDIDRDIKATTSPFLFLALDLPPPPLFQDSVEKNIIPQVTLASLLAKYDGVSAKEFAGSLKRYQCTRLPPYIIVHFKRFTKNVFVEEKNPTIVNFPIRGADFREVLENPPPGLSTTYDLVANVTHESTAGTARDKENTVWKVHLRAPPASSTSLNSKTENGQGGMNGDDGEGEEDRWLLMQDLIVEETPRELIFLGETVLQIWERRKV